MGAGQLTTLASLPRWMIFVFILMAMGPMMRMFFAGGFQPPHKRKRFDRAAADDVARLDSAIAERDTVIEDLQRRLSEMEERLDFTERLLAERSTAKESLPASR